jgi:tryptophan synthase alpha chain
MTNRIEKTFSQTQPFIGYLTAGDGGIEYSVASALAMIKGGVDILEIGIPFSDPIADGPVIQQAHTRALDAGTTMHDVLEIGRRIRAECDVPLVLFSYANPLIRKGINQLGSFKEVGFDALLTVDSTFGDPEDPILLAVRDAGLLSILLATPSTDDERLKHIGKLAEGFLYYVSQKGTTGIRSALAADYHRQMARLRKHIDIPIASGFGIGDRSTAQAALSEADGFIVGSAFVRLMAERKSASEITSFALSMDPRRN